jgi:hypothetical protein
MTTTSRQPGHLVAERRNELSLLRAQLTKYGIMSKPGRLALGRMERLTFEWPELKEGMASVTSGKRGDYWLDRAAVEAQLREHFPDLEEALTTYDARRRCPKCGKRHAATAWVTDRLRRTCKRCGFGWEELPLGEQPDDSPADSAETP